MARSVGQPLGPRQGIPSPADGEALRAILHLLGLVWVAFATQIDPELALMGIDRRVNLRLPAS